MQFDFYYDSDIARNRDIAKFELPVKKITVVYPIKLTTNRHEENLSVLRHITKKIHYLPSHTVLFPLLLHATVV